MARIGQEGNNVRDLRHYLADEENIGMADFARILEDATEVFRRCVDVGARHATIGLIYGHIQSGKTAVILTTMALAADNGYRKFIVLTTNLNDLYHQTLRRVESSLQRFEVVGKAQIARHQPSSAVAPVAIVASKGSSVLRRVSAFVQEHDWSDETVMIVDDEADQASLDTNINSTRPPSAINQHITDLRARFNSVSYLQTTATPGALLLQDAEGTFRPDFVVQTRPGRGYVGGRIFFGGADLRRSTHLRIVDPLDVQSLRNSNELPETAKRSLLSFFMGAAILRLRRDTKNYTYLMHTSFRRADHRFASGLVETYFARLSQELAIFERMARASVSRDFLTNLRAVYRDLAASVDGCPTFSAVVREMADAITSTRVAEINSQTGAGVDPDPTRRHTVYIGGMKIGRGVTIQNLLVTYYGRDAAAPQLDTVLQHARMYGYRGRELPVIRVFLPLRLAERFALIHRIDDDMRQLASRTHEAIPLIPYSEGRIRPTRGVVLNQRNVLLNTYVGGTKYFPANPISDPEILGEQTTQLDQLLDERRFRERQRPYRIAVDELLRILRFRFGQRGRGAWDDRLIVAAIETLRDRGLLAHGADLVIVNRNSKLSRNRDTTLGAVLPGNPPGAPYGGHTDVPVLYMTRVMGTAQGWHGAAFWIPVLRFQDGNYAFAANVA